MDKMEAYKLQLSKEDPKIQWGNDIAYTYTETGLCMRKIYENNEKYELAEFPLSQAFLNCFDDCDAAFYTESKNKEGRFISVLTADAYLTRSLLRKDCVDIFEKAKEEYKLGEYAEDWYIDFYLEYYPYTEEVALKVELNSFDVETQRKLLEIGNTCDRVTDGYVKLTPKEKESAKEAIVEYLEKRDLITEFYDMEQQDCLNGKKSDEVIEK